MEKSLVKIDFEEGMYSSINFLKNCSNEELEPLVKILTDSEPTAQPNKHQPYL